MTKEQAINYLRSSGFSETQIQTICNAITEPCEDCVSREEALKAIKTFDKFGYDGKHMFRANDDYVPYVHYDDIITAINELPLINFGKEKGQWVQISPAKIYECSICGQIIMTDDLSKYGYCFKCGAKMKGDD